MLAIVLALGAAAPAQSRATPPAATAWAETDRALALAGSLGTIVYALDRAAWVGTDAMLAQLPKATLPSIGGWVVERAGDRGFTVTFYRGTGAVARALFVAEVADGKVTAARPVTADVPLTPEQAALARARDAAPAEAVRQGLRPCTPRPFNTVVVQGARPDAPMLVYLLSPQVEAGTFPAGGHYRMLVGPDGSVRATRPFTRACLGLPLPKPDKGRTPAGLFVNHLLDPVPTEIHVFTSLSLGLPVFVGTRDTVWEVRGRAITRSAMKPPAPPR